MNDDSDDGTVRVPAKSGRSADSAQGLMRAGRDHASASTKAAKGDDFGPHLPPRPYRPHKAAPAVSPRPAAVAESGSNPDTEIEMLRPSLPTPPAQGPPKFHDDGVCPAPATIDPGSNPSITRKELDRVGPARWEIGPASGASELVEQPWTVLDRDPRPNPSARGKVEPPRPRSGVKTPSAYARPVDAAPTARPRPEPIEELRTMVNGVGARPGASTKLLMVQYLQQRAAGDTQWRDLGHVEPDEHVVGRDSFPRGTPATEFLANDHLRITTEGEALFVEEGETINGVYLKIAGRQPIELTPGTRFQVGQHVIEFRPGGPPQPAEGRVSPWGETFRSRPLEPMAYLDFVAPDGESGVCFPLTRVEGTVIGRDGDIELKGDVLASRSHAKVFRQGDRFFLEDLDSTNGTFLRITGRIGLKPGNVASGIVGDIVLIGAVPVRVLEL